MNQRPIIHDVGNLFDDRNLFLQVSVGLISFSSRFRRLAVRYGNPPVPRRRRAEESPAARDPVLDLLLGIASFSERGRDVLARVRAEAERAAAPERRRAHRGPNGLRLRGLLE